MHYSDSGTIGVHYTVCGVNIPWQRYGEYTMNQDKVTCPKCLSGLPEYKEKQRKWFEQIAIQRLQAKGVRVQFCWKGHAKTKPVASGYICPVCYRAAQERAKAKRKSR
jgi:hypothetical protein